jgi:hypothetical protein
LDEQPHRPGDPDATAELRSDSPHLIPLVYDRLRALAQKRLSEVPAERSPQATPMRPAHAEHPADPRPAALAEEIARWVGAIGENRTEAGR